MKFEVNVVKSKHNSGTLQADIYVRVLEIDGQTNVASTVGLDV